MSFMSPTSGGGDPSSMFSSMSSLMQALYGGQMPGQSLPQGQTSLYAPQNTVPSSVAPTGGSDASTNPFSSYLGAPITQNSNGSVSLGQQTNNSNTGVQTQSQSQDPMAMFSSFQQMIAPYLQELQGIGQNAQQANNMTDASMNTNLQNTAPVPTGPTSAQMQEVMTAAQAGAAGAGAHQNATQIDQDMINSLISQGFTPQQAQAAGSQFVGGSTAWGGGAPETNTWDQMMLSGLSGQWGTQPTSTQTATAAPVSTPQTTTQPVNRATAQSTNPFSTALGAAHR